MKLFPSAKALFALLLGLIMLGGLSACGDGGDADTAAPVLTLNSLGVDSNLERTRHLSGTLEPGAQLEVTADTAAVIGPVTVTADTWSCSVELVPGANTLSVKASDSTGNNLTLFFVLTYDVVTLDLVLPNTSAPTQTLGGTLVSGGSLSATLDGAVLPGAPNPTGNFWSWDITLAEGSHTLILESTDGLGQKTTLTQSLVLDSTLPLLTVAAVATPVLAEVVTINGTVADISTISLIAPTGVTIGAVTAGTDPGTWSCTLTGLLPGRNQIDITATAADGKLGTARLVVVSQP